MKEEILKKQEKSKKKIKNNTRGITLVALVVTIIILLILAGVSISLVFDSEGLFSKANDAATRWNQAKEDEEEYLGSVMNEIKQFEPFGEPDTTKKTAPDGEWYIPKGFEESEESAEKIKDGKVIKDEAGNEWVWIPCYLKDDNEKKVGQEMYTEATEYKRTAFKGEDIISDYTEALDTTDEASIKKYGGFYIGRYEAGADRTVSSADTTRKVLIQKDKYPYNWIAKADCTTKSNNFASVNKYDTSKVYTKLVSSYAWDTALCFIQKTVANYATYSPQGNYSDHKFSDSMGPLNTGLTTPVCNIYDMGGNLWECTSESFSYGGQPYASRGGRYDGSRSSVPAGHRSNGVGNASSYGTFRLTLYLE